MSTDKINIAELKKPIVSIGMPIFNDVKYLSKALDDLLGQSFRDYELIISDNASTDGSGEICQRYAAMDKRIQYIRQPINIGPIANFALVLDRAVGEFFLWAASDDRWHRDFISTLLACLINNNDCIVAFCPFIYIDEHEHQTGVIKHFDFSGSTQLERTIKFILNRDLGRDSFVYGLYRTNCLRDIRYPVWWWINKTVPINTAHPICLFILARGGYAMSDQAIPLWQKRLCLEINTRHHVFSHDNPIITRMAFVLRRINLYYEFIISVYRGSRSLSLTLVLIPFISIITAYECLKYVLRFLWAIFKYFILRQSALYECSELSRPKR